MPRSRDNGRPARAANTRGLTARFVARVDGERTAYNVWDTKQKGLVLRVQPTGHASYKAVYRRTGRPVWLTLGDANEISLDDARTECAEVMLKARRGQDPAAERRAADAAGTFAELADRYRDEYAMVKNKSWRQADNLVRRYLLPKWAKLKPASITRADVRRMMAGIEAPIAANQALAAASAVFSWAIKQDVVTVNPCVGIERNGTRSRDRILSDAEVPVFWRAFDDCGLVASSALKVILLTGQRPGEVAHMRREHVADGWWTMPGEPIPALGWPGTKNGQAHRVWLPEAARTIVADGAAASGFVFAVGRGRPVYHLDGAMRDVCASLGVDRATPHDLRRTHGSTVTRLGFGRDAMNRVQNHREGGIADVYDRHEYADENKRVMETVADHIMRLVDGRPADNVVPLRAN
jgi:integrase